MNPSKKTTFWLSRRGLAALAMVGFASYFLLVEHGEHLWGFLPYLILLLCPLMHLLMHHGHGHKGSRETHRPDGENPDSAAFRAGYTQGRDDAQADNGEGNEHGARYQHYRAATPAFVPTLNTGRGRPGKPPTTSKPPNAKD